MVCWMTLPSVIPAVLLRLLRPLDRPVAEPPSAAYWRLLLAALPDAMVVHYDTDLRCRMVAGPLLADLGLDERELLGRELHEIVDGPSRARLEPLLRRALSGTVASTTFVSARTGRTFDIEAAPFRRADTIGGAFVVCRDVSERRRQEAAVLRAETDLRTIFDASPIGHAVVVRSGQFVAVNHALTGLTLYGERELLAMDLGSLVHSEDASAVLGALAEVLVGARASVELDARLVRGNGQVSRIGLRVLAFERSEAAGRLLLQFEPDPLEGRLARGELEPSAFD
jgi:PAS domain S-box-containing protein